MSAPACPPCGRPIADSWEWPICKTCFPKTRWNTRLEWKAVNTDEAYHRVRAQLIREVLS